MARDVRIDVIAINSASNILSKIGDNFGVLGQAAAAAAAMVAKAFTELVSAGSEAQLSQERFNTLVASSGLADFSGEMQDLADTLSKVTRFEDENILEAEAMLATYDTIGQETLPSVLNASLDLAEFMKTDAASAAETLGRSFADISGGSLTLLRRSRLLTKEQVEQAEAMAKAGDVAGAQALVIEALDTKIGNLAENMGQTYAGQLEIFKNNIENIKEELGAKLLPILTPIIEKFSTWAVDVLPKVVDAFDKYIVPSIKNFVDLMENIGSGKVNLTDISQAFKEWIVGIDWTSLSQDLAAGINSIDWATMGEQVAEASKDIWFGLTDAVAEIDWNALAAAVSVGFLNFMAGLTGEESWANVQATWQGNFDLLVVMVNTSVEIIRSRVVSGMTSVRDSMKSLLTAAISGAVGILAAGTVMIITTISGWVPVIYAALQAIKQTFFNAFLQAGQQAIRGLDNIKAKVVDAVTEFIAAVRAAITAIVIPITFSMPGMPKFAGGSGGQTGNTGSVWTNNCFVAGTPVTLADRSHKNIEDIAVGDKILSYDITSQTLEISEVKGVWSGPHDDLYIVNDSICVTSEHPFYTLESGWASISPMETYKNHNWEPEILKVGQHFLNSYLKPVEVKSIIAHRGEVMTYNITDVGDYHTYFAAGVLVHNKASGGFVRGPGNGMRDAFMLPMANGEYVVNSRAVRQPGVLGALESLNSGRGLGSGSVVVNLTYAPMIETADRFTAQDTLAPFIIESIRRAKADGVI